ncbi:MAG TPA: glutathione transferase GstA [Steroidobacteraceae bacterium]|jgi:glutathione S-transferase|nr:glutathione transferase GstA [Steroidobacteraceae bacterium]
MKLYISPGACSAASHIVLRELGLPFDIEKINNKTKVTASGADFWKINPKGYVPALQLDDGSVLTEGPVIMQYLADKKPESGLAPANGTMERYRLQEWLGFINSELHKSYSPLFYADTPEQTKQSSIEKIGKRLDFIEANLKGKEYLLGNKLTIADIYLFVVVGWSGFVGINLDKWPAVKAHQARIGARPSAQAAQEAEKAAA